jgi:hypothetical protein
MMATLEVLAERFGYEDLEVAFPEIDIPVLTGAQRQGDILVVPRRPPAQWPKTRVQSLNGVVVTDSEISDNTHALYGDGLVLLTEGMSRQQAVWWRQVDNILAWLNVPEGGEAYLMHSEEHGALGIGPGTYQILQQQEFDEHVGWFPVAD